MNVAARVCRSPDSWPCTDHAQISLFHSPTSPKCSTRAILALINNLGIVCHQYCSSSVSSADGSGRFAIVAAVLGGLWWFYLPREWQARVFGDAVAHASQHPVRLRHQNRELAHVNGNNNITGVDLGRGGVVWLRRFLGRGRNGMWLGRLALFGLHTWNQNSSFFFRTGKFWSAAPSKRYGTY